uniref:phosphomannomutase n=1 Tax=Candidatus Kentrum sp. FM TaxID=2126340 RepID=A0A450SIH5_9GAMM|nr:MAG: phosphomannomutase / phosphoglucomutase [Candidatus Kentron sp. FM]VFJ61482.1 MAG: phosphomannomutase / phosphoglucomutase [Candidatus Kentron sp. FM]VFK10120.1 MAG: phosphomannomutase / phosphoglucomutase [Candidatus Kentron sp. FM]
MPNPTIFRAYDIRGIAGTALTGETAHEIGRAIGSEAHHRGQRTLVVGRDGRLSGPALQQALMEGIRSAGQDVIDIGSVATPVLYFATHWLETGSGVMVTGSHNPPEYNGFKIVLDGKSLFGDAIRDLHTRIQEGRFISGNGKLHQRDITPEYIRHICEGIQKSPEYPFTIVVDCGNGAAGNIAPALFRRLGHRVVEMYCDVDGNFPNHHPDPSQPENLQDLIEAVLAHGADFGLAFDGDGDRLGVVDNKGNIIWPDRQLMLFSRELLSRHPGATIVFDAKCSRHLVEDIRKNGGHPLMWKTGHSFIKDKMRETGALLAGEMSGHIFFKDRWYGFDDALYAGARLIEILMAANLFPDQAFPDRVPSHRASPHRIFATLPGGASTPELRIPLPEGQSTVFMERLMGESQSSGPLSGGQITTIDGFRIDYPDSWGLVRASNTTPSLVLRFEADDQTALARVQEKFRGVLTRLEPGLEIPF